MHTFNLDDDEVAQVSRLLNKLEPGFIPFDVLVAIARLTTMSTIEIIPYRKRNGKVEVLMLPRDHDDIFWPDALHTPGSIIRPTDTVETVIARIKEKELSSTEINDPVYVYSEVRKTERGNEHAQVFVAEVTGEPKVGSFYPVGALPLETIAYQRVMIARAVADL